MGVVNEKIGNFNVVIIYIYILFVGLMEGFLIK